MKPIPSTLSVAMHRVSNALGRFAPEDVQIVEDPKEAELQFIHTIGLDSINTLAAPKYSIIQYCLYTANGDYSQWQPLWEKAESVWSYYGLGLDYRKFDWLPLGIDPAFTNYTPDRYSRDIGIISSGYVTGPGAEAIEEVAIASSLAGMRTLHLGPEDVVGMTSKPAKWASVHGIPDKDLAYLYSRSKWVSGLRYVEGFELPVIEGLSCGARPIVFDRNETRKWFTGHAVFIPECSGKDLIQRLLEVFVKDPNPVTKEELSAVRERFEWKSIVGDVWSTALQVKHA